MDATTAVVVLIFVVSIFSGFGNNKGYKAPSAPVFPVAQTQPAAVYQAPLVGEPPPAFVGAGENAQPAINRHVAKYRSGDEAAQITDSIMRHSMTYNMNPKLVAALITRESKFNPRAMSSSGAGGLGQLLPSTAKGLGVDDVFDIDQNAKGTVRYFKSLIERFNGRVSSAIAAYLEGPNAVLRNGGYTDHTRSYVQDILAIYQKI
ncbi:MAG: lytic transglycosylase domain-containing protein [Candidatus Margulisbacteria bacterium]|nr:lytic transglycosylase domain-containing protein [Candidatus Margulisiibacteriota bacterium]